MFTRNTIVNALGSPKLTATALLTAGALGLGAVVALAESGQGCAGTTIETETAAICDQLQELASAYDKAVPKTARAVVSRPLTLLQAADADGNRYVSAREFQHARQLVLRCAMRERPACNNVRLAEQYHSQLYRK